MKKLTGLFFNLLVATIICFAIGVPAMAGAVGVGLFSVLTSGIPNGAFGMAIQKEIWETEIVKNLFADNTFLSKAYNADMFVLAGKVVHIPQAGAASTVVKNRSSLPATAAQRTDTEISYNLDEYTTTPRLVANAESVEASYNKMDSVIAEDRSNLIESVSNDFLFNWSPAAAGSILRTTGSAAVAHLPSATGNRNAITLADVRKAAFTMNAANVPQENRFAVLDATMYEQLVTEMSASQYRDFITGLDPATGVVGKYAGFSFYMRSKACKYSNAGTPVSKAWTTAGAATDNAAGLFWQLNSVERALGSVQVFNDNANPLYYGDIISFLVRAGGRVRRTDEAGVIAIVQAVPAG